MHMELEILLFLCNIFIDSLLLWKFIEFIKEIKYRKWTQTELLFGISLPSLRFLDSLYTWKHDIFLVNDP